jgi:hypothetical protein
MMEGKWFADTREGVRLHAAKLYPDGSYHIVAADIPDVLLERLFRSNNLDRFGPATYVESNQLALITPILEFGGHDT